MVGLRERKKERTRRELVEAAMDLFRERGYEETTVDDIAAVVDVSARTFFRYFDSKEAVLFAGWRESLTALEALLMNRPADESLMDSVRALCLAVAHEVELDRDRQLFIKEIVARSASAGDYEARVLFPAYREAFVRTVCAREGSEPGTTMGPPLAAAVGIAALHEAKVVWMRDPRQSLVALTDEAFAALAALFVPRA
jgi:AcrR family transcriptional regulator